MSDENVYRPQRKSIEPEDLDQSEPNDFVPPTLPTDEELRQQFEEEQAFSQKIRREATQTEDLSFGGEDMPFQIKGNVPPQFKQLLKNKGKNPPSQQQPVMQKSNPPMHVSGASSSKLQELLSAIKENSRFEEVSLPSKGKFYDGTDGPTSGIINLRPMTGEEEQILATPRFIQKGTAINKIFDRCIRENINSENLLSIDRNYLLIYLRIISYTPDYDVELKCPLCSSKFATTVDLNELDVNYCPDEFGEGNLSGLLPSTGYNYRYRLSRGYDERIIQEYRSRRLREFDVSSRADDTLTYRTAMLLDEVEEITDKLELQTLLTHLPIQDSAHLRSLINDQPFGVKTVVPVQCQSCFEDIDIELPLESNFFFPRAKKT